jgi:hypothetical protein
MRGAAGLSMRPLPLVLLIAFAVVLVAQHQLSDGEPQLAGPAPPELWEAALHPASADVHGNGSRRDCPLLISLDRNSRYGLTPIEEGVRFDIDADGAREQVSWTERGSDVAFLALDRDGDGLIEDGRELIGPHMVPGARSAPNALMELARRAVNSEPRSDIDGANPLFPKLLLWHDANHNGFSEAGEIRRAQDVLENIALGFHRHHRRDRHGNESRYRGFLHVRHESGRERIMSAEDEARRRRWFFDACLATR